MRTANKPIHVLKSYRFLQTFILSIIVSVPFAGLAQNDQSSVSNVSLAEKVYLQTDRQVYTTNDTIWFKGIVTSAFTHKPTALSGVLYVEMIAPSEQLLEKKLIKLTEGLGSGFFGIGADAPEGTYQLRAYT